MQRRSVVFPAPFDPTSATMNLVLLGLRGIAANVLWMDHEELFKTKNWARMEATARSIITLQPHFLQVWRYHGWHLAFNVSAAWDDVRDRYFWVKKGAKFTIGSGGASAPSASALSASSWVRMAARCSSLERS